MERDQNSALARGKTVRCTQHRMNFHLHPGLLDAGEVQTLTRREPPHMIPNKNGQTLRITEFQFLRTPMACSLSRRHQQIQIHHRPQNGSL